MSGGMSRVYGELSFNPRITPEAIVEELLHRIAEDVETARKRPDFGRVAREWIDNLSDEDRATALFWDGSPEIALSCALQAALFEKAAVSIESHQRRTVLARKEADAAAAKAERAIREAREKEVRRQTRLRNYGRRLGVGPEAVPDAYVRARDAIAEIDRTLQEERR